MEILAVLVIGIVVIVGAYLFINGRRNSDPMNRKCAAEICEYLVSHPEISIVEISGIFMRNARYKTQATHIVSMVPALLINAGVAQDAAMSVVPVLREAVAQIPE